MPVKKRRVYWSDIEFSQYLKKHGWVGKVEKYGSEYSVFVDDTGKELAYVCYDNYTPARRIYIPA